MYPKVRTRAQAVCVFSASSVSSIARLSATSTFGTISVGVCAGGIADAGLYTPVSTRNDFQPALFAPAISAFPSRGRQCECDQEGNWTVGRPDSGLSAYCKRDDVRKMIGR